uniref:Uncharacterized protein LOC113795473 n=1 Tax=Dermatophagoides pteronyssinus TaxID=6956 RepID=A0A6P6Y7Q5_DERPT|nr:uncharacterized protein LOC113795473 [Dermatophagoides pteronyssinus]
MFRQRFLIFSSILLLTSMINCQTLPPNVTNILNQLLEQSLADQQQNINGDGGGDGSNSSLTPANLSEIVRIFVQFLVAIFNAFQRVFAQSPMLRNDIVYKSWNDQDLVYNQNISFEKVLEERKEKFDQIFNTVQRFKRGAIGTMFENFSEKDVENLLEKFLKNTQNNNNNDNNLTRIKRNLQQFINLEQLFDSDTIEKLLQNYIAPIKSN